MNKRPYKTRICNVPIPLIDAIFILEKKFNEKGLSITRPQILAKLGNDILDNKIKINIPSFRQNNKNYIDIGGFNGKVKLKKR